MKNNRKQLITLAITFSIITAIYLLIFSKVAFSNIEQSTKVILIIILIALILIVALSLFFGLRAGKNNSQDEKSASTDKKNPFFSILIGVGIAALVVVGLLFLFFMAISG